MYDPHDIPPDEPLQPDTPTARAAVRALNDFEGILLDLNGGTASALVSWDKVRSALDRARTRAVRN